MKRFSRWSRIGLHLDRGILVMYGLALGHLKRGASSPWQKVILAASGRFAGHRRCSNCALFPNKAAFSRLDLRRNTSLSPTKHFCHGLLGTGAAILASLTDRVHSPTHSIAYDRDTPSRPAFLPTSARQSPHPSRTMTDFSAQRRPHLPSLASRLLKYPTFATGLAAIGPGFSPSLRGLSRPIRYQGIWL